jgi:predicted  nucleic acid-binding Zn-ribbon protein
MTIEDMFEKFRQLQDVLSRRIDCEREIAAKPSVLATEEEMLARLKASFIETNSKYEAERAEEAKYREQLTQAETDREKAEKSMEAVKTQREYEALDMEIRSATKREQDSRKELQKHERNAVELDEHLKSTNLMVQEQQSELDQSRASVENEIADKNAIIAELDNQSKALSNGLDPDVLFKFERIIRHKGGKGIVAIKNGVCTGCHMILPAQFANDVRRGEKIVFCPYCSRILYYEEADEGGDELLDEDVMGALAGLDDDEEADDESDLETATDEYEE